jgi:PKD repeat protein
MLFVSTRKGLSIAVFTTLFLLNGILSAQTNTPAQISDLALWLRSDTGVVITPSSNPQTVQQWSDISGNNYHAIQSTNNLRPRFVSSVTLINNKPAIWFDGSNDFLNGTTIPNADTSSLTIFIIGKTNAATGSNPRSIIEFGSNATGLSLVLGGTAGLLSYRNNGIDYATGISMSVANGSPYTMLEALRSFSSEVKCYRNADSVSTLNMSSATSFVNGNYRIAIGSTAYFRGEIAEIIVYKKVLTPSERVSVEQYLFDRYAPKVNLGADIYQSPSLCPVTLNAGAGYLTYQWSTNQSTSSIQATQSGSYAVTVTDVFNRTSTDSVNVFIPTATLKQKDTTICSDNSALVSLTLSDSLGYTFLWQDGSTSNTYNATSSGNYFVRVSDGNCFSYSDTLTLAVDSFSTTVSLGDDTLACVGTVIGLFSPTTNWSNLNFLWSTGVTDTTITIASSGTYSLEVKNVTGCTAYDTIVVTVLGNVPVASFPNDTICLGNLYQTQNDSYSTDTSSIVSNVWTFDGGNTINSFEPTFLFFSAGVRSVSLNVVTSVGCQSTKSGFVLCNYTPVADFTADTTCVNVPVIFNDLSSISPSDTIVQWEWKFGDGGTAVTPTPQHLYTSGGNYNVQYIVTSNNGCKDTSIQITTVVSSAPTPSAFNLIQPINGASLENNLIQFSWQPSVDAVNYILLISNAPSFSSATLYSVGNVPQYSLTLPSNNSYYWKVRAYNICNDSAESNLHYFSVFSPDDITGLALWLKSDTALSLVSGNVQQWADISGNNLYCTQSQANLRPGLASVSLINNKPSVVFDGTNDVLNGLLIPGIDSSSLTVFAVVKGNATTATQQKGFFAAGTTTGFQLAHGNANYSLINAGATLSGGSLPLTGFPYSILGAVKEYGLEARIYRNSIGLASSNSSVLSGPFVNAAYRLGIATGYFEGEIAEVIVYKAALDTNQRKLVEDYLYNYYAPPVWLGEDINQPNKVCPVILNAGNRFVSYLWSTGDLSQSIEVKKSGVYWVEVNDVFGRISRDTITVSFPYMGVNVIDTVVCNYESLNLFPVISGSPYSFLWNNNDTTQSISPTVSGEFVCAITDTFGCTFIADTIHAEVDNFATLNLLSDTAICSGNKMALNIGGYTPQIIQWNDGSSNTYNIISTQGNYAASVTDVNGCINSDAAFVQVKATAPTANFSAPNVCFGTSTQFADLSTVDSPDAISTWSWAFGDNQNSTAQNPSHLYLAPGDYTVTLRLVTDSGCTGEQTKVVTAAIPPIPAFNYPAIICAGTPVTLTDQTVFLFGDAIANWVWTVNGSDSIITKNAVYEFPVQGSYYVKLKAISQSGCSDTVVQKIDVFPPLTADFNVDGLCIGDSTSFADATSSLSIVAWQWSFGDFSLPSTKQNPMHKYNTPGSYSVMLTVENAIGCVDNVAKTVNVVSRPVAKFGNLLACEDQNYTPLDSSTVINDTISTWKWSFGNSAYNAQAPVHFFADTGSYSVKLHVTTQQGCNDSVTKVVQVKPRPKALFNFSPLYGEAPVVVSFVNQSTNATTYNWNFGDGDLSTDFAPSHTYTDNGTFTIQLNAVSAFGCEDSLQRVFLVAPTDLDIAIDKVTTNKQLQADGSYHIEVVATVTNLGTRLITNAEFYVTIGSGGVMSEEWSGELPSGGTMNVGFTAKFVVAAENANSYVCVTAVSVNNGETEVTTENNGQCTTTSAGIQLIGPSPNPMSSEAFLGIILPKAGSVVIDIADISGQYVIKGLQLDLPKGRTNYALPSDKMRAAEYFIRVYYNDEILVRKFIVAK